MSAMCVPTTWAILLTFAGARASCVDGSATCAAHGAALLQTAVSSLTDRQCVATCRDSGIGCSGVFRVRGGDTNAGFSALYFAYTLQQLNFAETNCLAPYIEYAQEQSGNYWANGTNPWEMFFEPVKAREFNHKQHCELPIEKAMEMNQQALKEQRYQFDAGRLHSLILRYYRLKPAVAELVQHEWQVLIQKRGAPVLGVQMRGTDRQTDNWRKSYKDVGPQLYLPHVQAFLKEHPDGEVFLATDDASYVETIREQWPPEVLAVLRMRNVGRSRHGEPLFKVGLEKQQEGLNALVDILLLAQCDTLLYGTSELPWVARWWAGSRLTGLNVEDDEPTWSFEEEETPRPIYNNFPLFSICNEIDAPV